MLYVLIGIIVFYIIYFLVSVFNSPDKLLKLYNKYMNINNNRGLQGKDVAFLGKHMLDLDIKIAYRTGTLTDAYSYKKKIVIMSEDVCNNNSIAAAGIVAHELGHAVQHRNNTALFSICTFLDKFCRFFSPLALPLALIGAVMYFVGWNVDIGFILLIIAVVLFIINILRNLLQIPLEINASEIGFEFLKDNELIDKKHYKKVKKLMSVAGKTYMKNFFQQLIPFKFR